MCSMHATYSIYTSSTYKLGRVPGGPESAGPNAGYCMQIHLLHAMAALVSPFACSCMPLPVRAAYVALHAAALLLFRRIDCRAALAVSFVIEE